MAQNLRETYIEQDRLGKNDLMELEVGEGLTPTPSAEVNKHNDNVLLSFLLPSSQYSWQEPPNCQEQQSSWDLPKTGIFSENILSENPLYILLNLQDDPDVEILG